jgi:hypothetical protein
MRIVEVVNSYVGQFELPGNQGFRDKVYEAKMVADGFVKGDAWCCLAQEVAWREAYPEHDKEFDRLFHKSCDVTYKNFIAAGYEVSTIPVVGSLMIMKKFVENKEQWQGHAGCPVKLLDNTSWMSVEGNTNSKGSREGDSMQLKSRSLMYSPTGLRVKGFILIREHLKITT